MTGGDVDLRALAKDAPVHFMGVGGSGMCALAELLLRCGGKVSGCDVKESLALDDLRALGADIAVSHDAEHVADASALVVTSAVPATHPELLRAMEQGIPVLKRAQALGAWVNRGRLVAIAGTHGKTTTTAMLAWALEAAGLNPGFLVGGIPENFGVSARLGGNDYFVIEADEYDTAFFDKRSKFIHYRPKTLIINNIEFDHADIFVDIAAIRREFHHLVRIVPDHGLIVAKAADPEIRQVLDMGCWTPVEYFGGEGARWQARPLRDDYSEFEITIDGQSGGVVRWDLIGRYNAHNALATAAAAGHVGITVGAVCKAMADFKSVKRRLQLLGTIDGITLYDDFAHHPTAIRETLAALRQKAGKNRIIAVMEPRSNTMKMGVHNETLAGSFQEADRVLFYQPPGINWDLRRQTADLGERREVFGEIDAIIKKVVTTAQAGDHIVFMSNGGFGGIQQRLIEQLRHVE